MPPQRIISLVPSQTELLFNLGLSDQIVGVTRFCVHPADGVRQKTVVGGTKTLHLDRIDALRPDLILANKEENTREQIEALQERYPVQVTDVTTLPDALAMIRTVGELTDRVQFANELADQIGQALNELRINPPASPGSVAYFIWQNPDMVAAGDTFIQTMLELTGLRNVFAGQSRYPVVTPDAVRVARPDFIFLSSEPFPFAQKHVAHFQTLVPTARVMLVDGELFSWYGSRLLRASAYLRNLQRDLIRSRF